MTGAVAYDGDVGGFYDADLRARAFGHHTNPATVLVNGEPRPRYPIEMDRLFDRIVAEVNEEFDRFGFCTHGYGGA